MPEPDGDDIAIAQTPPTDTCLCVDPDGYWSIREADGEEDAFYLAEIWDHYFGAEYDRDEKVLPYDLFPILGGDHQNAPQEALGLIAEYHQFDAGSDRIGAAIGLIQDREGVRSQFPDEVSFDVNAITADRNAWLMFSWVDADWRQNGIGRQMFDRRLRWAGLNGAEMAFGMSWDRDQGPTSRPLFDGAGFEPVESFEDYYADPDRRPACPDCGIRPGDDGCCQCAMTLWARELPMEVNHA